MADAIAKTASDLEGGDYNTRFLPSPAQIALALIILNSKPSQLSLQGQWVELDPRMTANFIGVDYLDQLDSYVQLGRRDKPAEVDAHLDGITFWKRAYEKSESTQVRLLDRIHELENHHDMQELGKKGAEVADLPVTTKRKRGNEPATKANSQSKRRGAIPSTWQPPDPHLNVQSDILQGVTTGMTDGRTLSRPSTI